MDSSFEEPVEGPSLFREEDSTRRSKVSVVSVTVFTVKVAAVIGVLNLVPDMLRRLYDTVAPPVYSFATSTKYSTKADLENCCINLTQMSEAFSNYARVHHGAYPASQYELVPDYLAQLPTCPAARRLTHRTTFRPGGHFRIECTGRNHAALGVAANLPSWDTEPGLRRNP